MVRRISSPSDPLGRSTQRLRMASSSGLAIRIDRNASQSRGPSRTLRWSFNISATSLCEHWALPKNLDINSRTLEKLRLSGSRGILLGFEVFGTVGVYAHPPQTSKLFWGAPMSWCALTWATRDINAYPLQLRDGIPAAGSLYSFPRPGHPSLDPVLAPRLI